MQRFANWTNLSETTFVLPPEDAAAPTTACGSSRRSPSCRSPATRRSAPATPGSRAATTTGDDASSRSAPPASSPIRRTAGGLAFAAPPLIRSGPVDEQLIGEHRRRAGHRAAPRSSTPQWVDNGPGWVAVLLESAEAVLAVRPSYADLDIGVVGPHPAGCARGDRGARLLPQGRRDRRGPGDRQPQRLAGRVAAAAPAGSRRPTSRARAPRSAAPAGSTSSQDADGTIWVGGGTVTCVAGEVEL